MTLKTIFTDEDLTMLFPNQIQRDIFKKGINMNEMKKDFIIGMLYALASYFRDQFSPDQRDTFVTISETINEIYYPKKVLETNNDKL